MVSLQPRPSMCWRRFCSNFTMPGPDNAIQAISGSPRKRAARDRQRRRPCQRSSRRACSPGSIALNEEAHPPPPIEAEDGSFACSGHRTPIGSSTPFRERAATGPVPNFGLEPPTKSLSLADTAERTGGHRCFEQNVVGPPVRRSRPAQISGIEAEISLADEPYGSTARRFASAPHWRGHRDPHRRREFGSLASSLVPWPLQEVQPVGCARPSAVCLFLTLRAAVARIAQRCASSTSFQPVGALGRAARHVCSHQPA